jgi:hypothetical protein
MARFGVPLGLVLGAALLASCAQQEEPTIGVEPYYDKVSGASCPAGQYLDTSQPQRLVCVSQCPGGTFTASTASGQQICVPGGGCPPGTQPVAGTAGQQCVPVQNRGERPQSQPDPQRPGTAP